MKRRSFITKTALGLAIAGDFALSLPRVGLAETQVRGVRFSPEIEPLVRLLEETSRERVLEEMAYRVKRGTSYREIVAALFLAGVRNIQPRPVGFKFHAVLVVNAAHLASISSREQDRWLPIFWAIDQFKASQAAAVREGNWSLGPVDEPAVPPSHKARQMLVDALDNWDEAAADAAITGLVRTAGANEIFEILAKYGARDFREIGHKEIYTANSFRALEVIGWDHAEPILRSLTYAILDRNGEKLNPSKADLPADRPFRHSVELARGVKSGWMDGKPDEGATIEMLRAIRESSALGASETAVRLIQRGTSPQSLFNAYFAGAMEHVMRAPGILSLHAVTFTNALHYAWQRVRDEETRKILLIQNAAFLPLFRGNNADKGLHIDEMRPPREGKPNAELVEEVFAELGQDKAKAAQKAFGFLSNGGAATEFVDAARRLIFAKGRDAHDYKFSSAVLEDHHFISGGWRERYLAGSVFNLRGGTDTDNELIKRIRTILG